MLVYAVVVRGLMRWVIGGVVVGDFIPLVVMVMMLGVVMMIGGMMEGWIRL